MNVSSQIWRKIKKHVKITLLYEVQCFRLWLSHLSFSASHKVRNPSSYSLAVLTFSVALLQNNIKHDNHFISVCASFLDHHFSTLLLSFCVVSTTFDTRCLFDVNQIIECQEKAVLPILMQISHSDDDDNIDLELMICLASPVLISHEFTPTI